MSAEYSYELQYNESLFRQRRATLASILHAEYYLALKDECQYSGCIMQLDIMVGQTVSRQSTHILKRFQMTSCDRPLKKVERAVSHNWQEEPTRYCKR